MKEMDTWWSLGKLLTLVVVLVSYHFAARNSGLVFDVLIFLLCSLGLVFCQMNVSVPDKASSSSSSSLPASSSSSSSSSSTSSPSSSSSSSASLSSSSSSKGSLYDVFISFRGEDTRKKFTGHLYEALTRAGINAFIDDEELKKGEELTTAFERAIQGSKISIIVFSIRYANSSWCLEELVKIMECRRTPGQLVLPIFYDVNPSDVRKQRGSFGQSFLDHIDEKKVEICKVKRWRTALFEASNLSGWDLQNTLDGMITEEVLRKLNNAYLDVAPYPVGIDSRVQDISKYLHIGDSNDVRVIGIWGIGGIGKTTLARAVYNQFSDRFQGKSFLEKVREKKLEKLQKQLLYDILQYNKTKVSSVAAATALVGERFQHLKVLVIFDDVDDVKQLHELARNRHSFGPGSRIIITTRNEHVLKEFAVDMVYPAIEMKQEEALELLSWHAFRSSCFPNQYLELAREVVNYCGGLPLALQMLGSSLFEGSVAEWKSILDKLKEIPPGKIQAQLKISYDGLNDDLERRIFLDIACFFIGMDKNYVIQILDGCGFCATTGIKVLLDRCLVTINSENKIMMHDLLRDMGRDIVRAENTDFHGERSRLWRPKDVKAVLIDKFGTEKIEGLALDLPRLEETSFSTEALRNMKRLRLLQLNYVQLAGEYQCLFKNLRWLCWHGFPLEFIPIELCQPNIVAIDMRYSSLKQVLCEDFGLLEKLKILNLSRSHDLTQSPDFSKLPNLEKLILKDCKRLAKVHKSIGDLKSLVLVNLKDCETLKALPRSFCKLKSVKTLVLDGCSRFQSLPDNLGELASLVTLCADGTAIKKVPPSIGRLEKLEYLSLSNLKCSLQLPSLRGLRSLTKLRLEDSSLMEVPNDIGSSLPCLRHLYLNNNNFRSLPSLSSLSHLVFLNLKCCRNLVEITDLPQSLENLNMDNCSALERMLDFSGMSNNSGELASLVTLSADGTAIEKVPPSIGRLEKLEYLSLRSLKCSLQLPSLRGLRSLTELHLEDSNLMEVPKDIRSSLPCLRYLYLNNNNFRSLPSLSSFSHLFILTLNGCRNLVEITDLPQSLGTLIMDNCSALERMPDFSGMSNNLGELASLVTLSADGTAIKEVPPSIGRLEKLEYLFLGNLKCSLQLPSLRGLRSLTRLNLADNKLKEVPNDIGSSLPCLQVLYLDNNNFRSLPNLSGLSKLYVLVLNGCRNLVEITDLPQSLDSLWMYNCSAFERMPDFSGMLTTFVILGSPKLIEFPGLDSALNSGLTLHMTTHNNVMDFILKDSTLQGWTGCGFMNLVGRQIPTWFNHVNEGIQVRFEVPKEIGCNAKALAVCLACCPYDHDRGSSRVLHSSIYVINHTKRTSFVNSIYVISDGEYIWLGNFSLPETDFNLEEGDSVHVIVTRLTIEVKKIGVRLLCDKTMTREGGGSLWKIAPSHSIPYKRALKNISRDVEWRISHSDSIPYTEALKDSSREVDDFDEDYDENDDEEDRDNDANDEDDENDDEEDRDDDANDEDDDNHDDEDGDNYKESG